MSIVRQVCPNDPFHVLRLSEGLRSSLGGPLCRLELLKNSKGNQIGSFLALKVAKTDLFAFQKNQKTLDSIGSGTSWPRIFFSDPSMRPP